MRPGRFHPGNVGQLFIRGCGPMSCFNEAGAFPPRKSAKIGRHKPIKRRFNEAGAFPPRKYV